MGRAPCCEKHGVRKGAWTPEEDDILVQYILKNGTHGTWRSLPKLAGLMRCGKSCRLRWTNYLRPNIRRGPFTPEEENSIIQLHGMLGNKWAAIASKLPGRTDNEIKNFWNTHFRKRVFQTGFTSHIHHQLRYRTEPITANPDPSTRHMAQWENARVEAEARLSSETTLFNPFSLPSRKRPEEPCDYFLRIWNSEVGESFRTKQRHCHSEALSSRIKMESSSAATPTAQCDKKSHNVESEASVIDAEETQTMAAAAAAAVSEFSSSYEMDESVDTALKLLLDFTSSADDVSFLRGSKDFSSLLDIKFD